MGKRLVFEQSRHPLCPGLQVCAAVGLCDQSAVSREAIFAKSRRLLMADEDTKSVGDDTFCAFCNMAVSYMKVASHYLATHTDSSPTAAFLNMSKYSIFLHV